MKLLTFSLIICCSFFSAFSQIVQPGQLEILVYPGAQLENIDAVESKVDTKIEVFLFEDFTFANVCFNKNQCYENLQINIDLLNRYIILKKENDEIGYLSFSFLYSLQKNDNNSTFQLIKTEADDQPMLSEILFENDKVVFYKKYFVKTIQANYRPEFDTGTKEPTFEEDHTFEFIDELGNQYSFSKIRKRTLRKSINPESAIFKEHIKSNKVKDTEGFIDALKKTY